MNKLVKNTVILFVFFILYFPILILVIYSFNEARYSMKITALSVKWYSELMNNPQLWQSAKNSFLLAFLSSTITSALSTIAASTFYFYDFKTKKNFQKLLLLMIMIPDIIFAIGLLILFNLLNIKLGFLSLLIAHISFSLPFAILLIQNQVTSLDKNLLLVCQDLGAYDYYSFKKIILPLLSNGILSAFLLSFTLSFDDVLISYFTSGPSFQILPLTIYSLIRSGINPEINALCTLLFLISVLSVSLSYYLIRKKK